MRKTADLYFAQQLAVLGEEANRTGLFLYHGEVGPDVGEWRGHLKRNDQRERDESWSCEIRHQGQFQPSLGSNE